MALAWTGWDMRFLGMTKLLLIDYFGLRSGTISSPSLSSSSSAKSSSSSMIPSGPTTLMMFLIVYLLSSLSLSFIDCFFWGIWSSSGNSRINCGLSCSDARFKAGTRSEDSMPPWKRTLLAMNCGLAGLMFSLFVVSANRESICLS